MGWFSWTLLSVATLVAYYFFSKKLFNDDKNVDPRFYGGMLQVSVGLLSLIPAFLNGWYFEWSPRSIGLIVLMAITYTIGPSLYYTGLKHTHLSVTTTLDATGAIYALVLGVLILHESLDFNKLLGAGLILLAIVIVSGKSSAMNKLTRYETMLVISPLFYAIGAIIDNTLIIGSNALTYLSISFGLAGLTMIGINLPRLKSVGVKNISNHRYLKTLVISAIFVAVSSYSSYRAYQVGGQVSVMYPIMQSESVIVPFMAMWLLRERERFGHKIVGAILAFLGVWILGM